MNTRRTAIFADDLDTARDIQRSDPKWKGVHLLTPRRVTIGAQRGLRLEEVHLFGTAAQVAKWYGTLRVDPAFVPVFAGATDPVIVMHLRQVSLPGAKAK